MKEPHFFIEKSEEYLKEIEILTKKFQETSVIDSIDDGSEKSIFTIAKERRVKGEAIATKVKLMLGEFDNSQPLLEQLKNLENAHKLTLEDYNLTPVSLVLNQFIDHLSIWRIDDRRKNFN